MQVNRRTIYIVCINQNELAGYKGLIEHNDFLYNNVAFLYDLETDREKSISLIRRCAFHRSALLRFASLQKRSLRQETRAAKLTRALLGFNSVGDHDPFSLSLLYQSQTRVCQNPPPGKFRRRKPHPFLFCFSFSPIFLPLSAPPPPFVVFSFSCRFHSPSLRYRDRVCTGAKGARRSLPAAKGLTITERSMSAIRELPSENHCSSS